MKIKNITLTNFLGINGASDFECRELTLFCGPNGSGKSRIADAIAFALTGQLCRGVTKKKDFGLLITSGQKKASVSVEFDNLSVDRTLPDNHSSMSGDGAILHNDFLPYCLDMHKFGAMQQDSRREFLMRLTGVKTDTGSIKKRMLAMSCDPDKTEIIAPMVRAGFEQAETSAKDEARQEKANWRAVTGRTWSVNNGEDWAPDPVEYVELGYPHGEHEAKKLKGQEKCDALVKRHAEMLAIAKLRSNPYFAPDVIERLEQELVDKINQVAELEREIQEVTDEKKPITAELQEISKELQKHISACPECGALLDVSDAGISLLANPVYPEECNDIVSRQSELLSLAEESQKKYVVLGMQKVELLGDINKKKADLENIKSSVERLSSACTDIDEEVTEASINNIAIRIENGRKYKAELERHYREWELAEGHKLRRDEKAMKAATHHTNVMQWLHIADALSPSGIPQQMVSDALVTVNAEISTSCAQIGLAPMSIESDMSIKYRYRPYHLLSESEQWRVDMVCATVISKLCGIGIVVLDRLDILDLRSRQMIMKWLSEQHKKMQSIVLATLKAPLPSNDWMSCHWLGDK